MAWVNRMQGLLGGRHVPCKIALVGLPNSGKSTIMIQLKPPDARLTKSTLPMEYCAEEFKSMAMSFVSFDLGRESDGFGNPWEDSYKDCDAVIFVIDSTDRYNVSQTIEQLEKLYDKTETRDIPLMFLANKSDQSTALPKIQVQQMLKLSKTFKDKTWSIHDTVAITGEGFNEAMDWLGHKLRYKCRKDLKGPMLKC